MATLTPFNVGVAGVFLLLPVLYLLRRAGAAQGAWYGAIWGLLVGAHMYLGVAAYSAFVFVLVLFVVMAVSAVLFAATARALRSGRLSLQLCIPLLWVLSELLLNAVGVPYTVSVLVAEVPWVIAPAQWVGSHGVAALIYLGQTAVFLLALPCTRTQRTQLVITLAGVCAVFVAAQIPSYASVGRLHVAVVQTNSHPYWHIYKAADGVLEQSQAQRDGLFSRLEPTAELVVWPEWAVLGYELRVPSNRKGAVSAIQLINAQDIGPQGVRRNVVAAINADREVVSVAGKTRLIPFIEQSFDADDTLTMHADVAGRPVSTICYESVFSRPLAERVRDGAGLITIHTSDAYAGPSLIPILHARYARLRAVENHRYVLRAANGGVSMVVAPDGRVRAALPLFNVGVLHDEIDLYKALTPYSRFAGFWHWGLLALGLGALYVSVRTAIPPRAAASDVPLVVQTLTLLFAAVAGVLAIGLQLTQLSTQLAQNVPQATPRSLYKLFYANAYSTEGFSYEHLHVSDVRQSANAALTYLLRTYGISVDRETLEERWKGTENGITASDPSLDDLATQFGLVPRTLKLGEDTWVLPALARMNSGEFVVLDSINGSRLTMFSPVNGVIELELDYVLDRLMSDSVVFLAPPLKPWDR